MMDLSFSVAARLSKSELFDHFLLLHYKLKDVFIYQHEVFNP